MISVIFQNPMVSQLTQSQSDYDVILGKFPCDKIITVTNANNGYIYSHSFTLELQPQHTYTIVSHSVRLIYWTPLNKFTS